MLSFVLQVTILEMSPILLSASIVKNVFDVFDWNFKNIAFLTSNIQKKNILNWKNK